MADLALDVFRLDAWYGESRVLRGLSFSASEGEIVALVGRNGVGKTTTLRSIMGLISKRSGSIRVFGQDVSKSRPEKVARKGVAFCPEERGIFSSLSVEENLLLPPIVAPGGLSADEIYELFPSLAARRFNQGTKLSGGEQQMLAIGRTMRTGARLILLDEPTEGLAPVIVRQIAGAIRVLKERKQTVVLVEQNFAFVRHLADRFCLIEGGKVVDEVAAVDMRANASRIQQRLGI